MAIPKKKFTFAKKSNNVAQRVLKEAVSTKVDPKLLLEGNHMSIRGLKDQEYISQISEYEGKENLLIENIENCTIKIPFVVKSIYIKNIKNSNLYVSAVMGATFIDTAESTEIYLASH